MTSEAVANGDAARAGRGRTANPARDGPVPGAGPRGRRPRSHASSTGPAGSG